MDKLVYTIWLSLSCAPGSSTFNKLLGGFSSSEEIFNAELDDISKIIGYRNSDRARLANKNLDAANRVYEFCKKHNVGIVSYFDEAYPNLLRDISAPPVLLYYRGRLPDFNKRFSVACVGTRAISDYGRSSAFRISHDLASAGAIIVSGMAKGIDGISAAGAISAGGTTVAVLGSGIDVCYPAEHLKLAREIVKDGCIITEYAPGSKPDKYNFPKRNRIISGLSHATIIFEGDEKSGARHTADYAKKQERALYALPGNVGSKTSELPNLLLKNGAKPCTSAEDIINDFSKEFPYEINPFNMSERLTVNMMAELRRMAVVALAASDDVFNPPKPKKVFEPKVVEETEAVETRVIEPDEGFDKAALEIYKKIPLDRECPIESLVDETNNLRSVMKLLLKLEMNGFVLMLPGESVARKTR